MTSYTIGIDTGGTHTDAVIIAARQRKLFSSAKSLTTRGVLADHALCGTEH